jgi:CheY-like chemotaxis protein
MESAECHPPHEECARGGIRDGGCDAYLSKPISVPKFIETIRRFLGVGQSMPAVSRRAERRRRN